MTDVANPLIAALQPLVSRVRTDVTAVKKKEGGSRWTREALTTERLARHLNGGPPRGVCFVGEGASVTMVGLLDFDAHKGEVSWAEMSAAVGAVMDAMVLAWGSTPIVFRSSGGSGVHVYAMWENPQDARSVRRWLNTVLESVGLTVGTGGVGARQVEIFPKQDIVPVGGYGNQVILPLAGKSEWLAWCELSGMLVPAGGLLSASAWQMSPPVPPAPIVERVARAAIEPLNAAGAETLRSALAAITDAVNAGRIAGWGRDGWRNVLFGIHEAYQGDEDGRGVAHAWSQSIPDYDAREVDKIWDNAEPGKARAIGVGSLKWLARSVGWLDPAEMPDIGDFEPILAAADGGSRRQTAADGGDLVGGGGDLVGGAVLEDLELPPFRREKSGAILPLLDNAAMAFRRPDLVGLRIGYDEFRDEITVARPGTDEWQAIKDPDVVEMRIRLERLRFKSVPKELARDVIVLVARENRYDSAQLWLTSLPAWDGVSRIERFLIDSFGAADTAYSRAVARYLWTALAARVMSPGCQADMAPVLKGPQGMQKTSAVRAMVPGTTLFVEVDFTKDDAELARVMRGTLVGEIGELRGLHTKDQEGIKGFVSRRFEKWTPKYEEFSKAYSRRCILIGTTNLDGILSDDTGNRRWLPIEVTKADVERVERDRDQLWAEGLAIWKASGVAWQDAERLAPEVHREFMVEDAWEGAIEQWVNGFDPFAAMDGADDADDVEAAGGGAAGGGAGGGMRAPRGAKPFTSHDVLVGALGLSARDMNMLALKRVGAVLRALGFFRKNARGADGTVRKMWIREKSTKMLPV
jgi:hypothetical protein